MTAPKRTMLYAIVLLAICLLSRCSYLTNVKLLTEGELRRSSFVETLPFEFRKDLIVVKVYVNADTTPREFIFDTGAFNSKIEKELADQTGLETVTTKSNSTAAGVSRDIEVTRIDTLRLGKTSFYNIAAGKVVYDEKSASPCIAADGIIGANLMKLAHWKIDFEKMQIQFSDKPFPEDPNRTAFRIPFSTPALSGTPYIDISVNGRIVENVLLDIGYNGGLVLPAPAGRSFSSQSELIIYDRSTSGIYGSKTDTLEIKELTVSLDDYQHTMPVSFSGNGKALLGTGFLKSSIILIDYDQEYIIIQPLKEISNAPAKTFIPGILNDSLWVVDRVSQDLPFALGDTLRHVNGRKPGEIFRSHCEYITNISSFLGTDPLQVETIQGNVLFVRPTNSK